MKKTNQEILDRYKSDESFDIFEAQRTALICMLPYEVAKPHLDEVYVAMHDAGELDANDQWKEGWEVKEQILDFLPHFGKSLEAKESFDIAVGLGYLKSWTWAEDESFYDTIAPKFEVMTEENLTELYDTICTHYGYEGTIVDTPFEEIPTESTDSETES